MRNVISIFLTALCLIAGLSLPFLTARIQDALLTRAHWPFARGEAHYAYQGTLSNRVLALSSHLNASPAVAERSRESAPAPDGLLDQLSSFLPITGQGEVVSERFTLSPVQYSAEYAYAHLLCTAEDLSLTVIADAETGLPLRIELQTAPEGLEEFLQGAGMWDLLSAYAAAFDLGQLADGRTSISTLIHSQSAQIRGMPLSITATAMPAAGTLLIKLTAGAEY